jgi:L-fuconolactonase
MPDKADAHLHLFEGGFRTDPPACRPGVEINEALFYESLMESHGVKAALVVGFTGDSWCARNNEFLAGLMPSRNWIRAVAYCDIRRGGMSINDLEQFREMGFIGTSLYVFEEEDVQALEQVDDDCWRWISNHRWLVSINSKGTPWQVWPSILDRHNNLRLVVSHLGLPPCVASPPAEASATMADVTTLAGYPGVHVKLSGFYALTDPGHDYPHEAAWPYVRVLKDAFGADRLLWGSDFSPHLDWISFPQTFDLFGKMPFLTDEECDMITGRNLLILLDEVE